jgi:uncharacterized membrane protein YjjP (DUF1212 family)
MAEFNDRDTSGSVTIPQTVSIEAIVVKRYRNYANAPVEITVTKLVNGVTVIAKVPQATVDTIWPGNARTFKAWLLAIIDAAV